jgi:hypothetical protein
MTQRPAFLAALLLALLAPGSAAAGEGPRPVLVELFTSQGCSSCPPADRLLGELAERPGIVALSLHVDYWDYLGWRDTFARPAFTRRQYAYREALGEKMVFTPQAIVQGAADAVGSNADHLRDLIAMAREREAPARVEIVAEAGGLLCRITPLAEGARGTIWIAEYDIRREVEVARGENGGRRLAYHNVVRRLVPHGDWAGEAEEVVLEAPGEGRGLAVWLQEAGTGRVLAAARHEP